MPRSATPLTEARIKNTKPGQREVRLYDTAGLYLSVMPTGARWWRVKYRLHGRERRAGVGCYPDVTLAQARAERDRIRLSIRTGEDPVAERRAARATAGEDTFSALAEEWFAYNSPRWANATTRKARMYLDKDMVPALGARKIRDITRAELVSLVRKIERREAFNVASKVRQWLHQIFRFALAKGVIDSNPSTDLDVVAAPPPKVQHRATVPLPEIPKLLAAIDASDAHVFPKWAAYLLLYTAARPGELREAPWSEFDLDAATWSIPAERMKMRRPHVVPLPRQAVTILRSLHRMSGHMPLVFPGRTDSAKPMSDGTINGMFADIGYKGRQTGHGFRHLVSTELHERGYESAWIEAQLAHGDDDKIRGTYNKATYLPQRKKMMQTWADLIDTERKKKPA